MQIVFLMFVFIIPHMNAMVPTRSVGSKVGTTSSRILPKKSTPLRTQRGIALQTLSTKEPEKSQKKMVSTQQRGTGGYLSKAYTNFMVTSGNLWNSFKNIFKRSVDHPKVSLADIKPIEVPSLPLLNAPAVFTTQSIKSEDMPLVTAEQAIARVAHDALQDIEKEHRENSLPLAEKGLMVCTPPGINAMLLLEFDSIEAIREYFKKRYHELDLKYKEINGIDDATFDRHTARLRDIQSHLINVYYKNPRADVVHDKNVPPFILEETKRMLALVGINPMSVNIVAYSPTNRGEVGGAVGPGVINEDNSASGSATIYYNVKRLKKYDHKAIVAAIAHEVGHLLRCHSYSIDGIEQRVLDDEAKNVALAKIVRERDLLHELEADVTIALLNKDVAQTIHQFLLEKLARPHSWLTPPTSRMSAGVYQSFNHRYHWIHRINELHKKHRDTGPEL